MKIKVILEKCTGAKSEFNNLKLEKRLNANGKSQKTGGAAQSNLNNMEIQYGRVDISTFNCNWKSRAVIYACASRHRKHLFGRKIANQHL